MGNFKNRLTSMGDAWTTGKDGGGGIPDGQYILQLESATLKESAQQKLMIVRKHIVLEGDSAGDSITDFLCLETEFGPRQVAQWIEKMGYEVPQDVADIEEIVAAIANEQPTVNAKVKRSGDSDLRNVTVTELISTSAETPAPVAAKPAPAPAKPAAKPAATPATAKKAAAPVKAAEPASEVPIGAIVKINDEGKEIIGTIIRLSDDGNPIVESNDAAKDQYEVNLNELEYVTDEASAPEAEAAPLQDTSVLLAFCAANGIEANEEELAQVLEDRLKEYQWTAAELTPEEVALLESIEGITLIKPAPKPAPKPVAKPVAAPAPKPVAKPAVAAPKLVAKPAPAPAKPAAAPAPKPAVVAVKKAPAKK